MAKKKFVTIDGVKYEQRIGTEGADNISGKNLNVLSKGGNDNIDVEGESLIWAGDGLDILRLGKGNMTAGAGPQDDVIIVTGDGNKKLWNGTGDDQTYANKVKEGELEIGLGEGNDYGVGGGTKTTMYGGKDNGNDHQDTGTAKEFIGFNGLGADKFTIGNPTLKGELYCGNDTDPDTIDFTNLNARAEIDAFMREADWLEFKGQRADLNDTTNFTISNMTDEGFTLTTANGGKLNIHGLTAAELGYTGGTDTVTDPGTPNPDEPLVSEDYVAAVKAYSLDHFANDTLF